jgi:hypothetical protein
VTTLELVLELLREQFKDLDEAVVASNGLLLFINVVSEHSVPIRKDEAHPVLDLIRRPGKHRELKFAHSAGGS